MEGQISLFDYDLVSVQLKEVSNYKIRNKVRLIELFAGIGSQAMAMKRLGVDFEHYRVVEFDKYPVASYNAIHGTDFEPMDIRALKGEDLGIVDTDNFTYIMTYSFPCFVGNTMVLTNKGYKEIKDIKVDDCVLTHNNTYEKVIASKSTGIKETYSLKGMCFDEIECTIVQVKMGSTNIERYMKITTESNLNQNKLFTILTLIARITELKIFTSMSLQANIKGCINIIEDCENNFLMKISSLSMEIINERTSNTNLYKQAGNSIVCNVLVAIMGQLFEGKEDVYKEI